MAVPRTRVLRAIGVNAAADAFAQIEIPTGLFAVEQGHGLLIRRITIQDVTDAVVGATISKDLALSRRSKTAVPDITDPDCIFRWRMLQPWGTSVGFFRNMQVHNYDFPSGDESLIDQLIVEDPLFMQVDSAGISAVITLNLRLQCEIVKVSELQRLALISLSQS